MRQEKSSEYPKKTEAILLLDTALPLDDDYWICEKIISKMTYPFYQIDSENLAVEVAKELKYIKYGDDFQRDF